MVMAGDGHANIFHVNSLADPNWEHPAQIEKIKTSTGQSGNERMTLKTGLVMMPVESLIYFYKSSIEQLALIISIT